MKKPVLSAPPPAGVEPPHFLAELRQAQQEADRCGLPHPTGWEPAEARRYADALLAQLCWSEEYRFTPLRAECCRILAQSLGRVPAALWFACAELLLCRDLPLAEPPRPTQHNAFERSVSQ